MSVIAGGAITRRLLSNTVDLFSVAESSEGDARVDVLKAALSVSKQVTAHIEGHLADIEKAAAVRKRTVGG